jgi:putative spermidine/putrescine transport system substrate-binding protein/spermidine/putrescine transport system substrate-binding protein
MSFRIRSLLLGIAVAAMCAGAAAPADDSLIVLEWSGYEDPLLNPAYVEKHPGGPEFSFAGDEDEAFEKVRAGFKADVGHPCAQSVEKWRDAGLLQPLDTSKIAGWDDILSGFKGMKNLMTDDNGTPWFMPFDWGNTALLYRTDKVSDKDAQSLRIFADPKYRGRVSIGDNADDAYALASLVIGLKDWATMTDAEFAEASAFLRDVHKNIRLYWTDDTDINQAFTNNEIDLAWGWNETAKTLAKEGLPLAMKRDTKEGLSTWVCGYVLFKDASENLANAYEFLSARNAPHVAKYLVSEFGYGHGNAVGMASSDPQTLKAGNFDDLDRFLGKTLFQSPVAPELKQRMIAEFEKIKAGF